MMADFKKIVIGKNGINAAPLQVTIDGFDRALPRWRTETERNHWLRQAMQGVGNYWIDEYLPLRWVPGYAKRVLRYLKGGKTPFLDTGLLKETALAGAKAKARSTTSKGPSVRIRIPGPPYINYNPDVRAGMTTVPPSEILVLARVLERELALSAQSSRTIRIQRGRTAGQFRQTFRAQGAASNLLRRRQLRERLNRNLRLRPRSIRQHSLL